jgi:hypothetical protein
MSPGGIAAIAGCTLYFSIDYKLIRVLVSVNITNESIL